MAVIYSRVSTDEQKKSGLGLEAQEEACRRLCEIRNYEIDGVFRETISGKTKLQNRTIFMECYTLAVKKKTIIMVSRLDRFSRVLGHIANYMDKETFYKGARYPEIICADCPDADILLIQMNGMMSQQERRLISLRTREALARLKAKGKELGKVGREVIHKKMEEVLCDSINRAMELHKEGESYSEIAKILNSEGYSNSKGEEWNKSNIYKRLKVRLKKEACVEYEPEYDPVLDNCYKLSL